MNKAFERFYPSEMGISEPVSSAIDCLQFEELERMINLILEDFTPQQQESPLISEPNTSINTYRSSIRDEKSRSIQKVSKKIMDIKTNFVELYENLNYEIDNTMKRIRGCIRKRELELKNQLRRIAEERIIQWDYQLGICNEFLAHLQGNGTSNHRNSDFFISNNLIHDMQYVELADIKFEAYNIMNILRSVRNLGTFICDNRPINCGLLEDVMPKMTFGSSGDAPGQFCRPWGVCVDSVGRILVCDRSNHRIQIFNESGEFLLQFGKEGSDRGEFNRPTGIDADSKKRIIVADKDNHRIQVFSHCGSYIFAFGSQGTWIGQFMYPWDVAVNAQCEIAVSDSKNHRVQLFTEKGKYITHFDSKKARMSDPRLGLDVLDSPRGLAFRSDGSLLVTDFNHHRIIILNQRFNKCYYFGSEGRRPGQFFRPQGIACDKNGYFVVSDSKNYRIQVFDPSGKIIRAFGRQGTEPGEFDCPQGICIHPNQNLIVVDFSNNRVQVF